MINFEDVIGENLRKHNPNWPQVHNHLYRILIKGESKSEKVTALLYLISHQPKIDKVYV